MTPAEQWWAVTTLILIARRRIWRTHTGLRPVANGRRPPGEQTKFSPRARPTLSPYVRSAIDRLERERLIATPPADSPWPRPVLLTAAGVRVLSVVAERAGIVADLRASLSGDAA